MLVRKLSSVCLFISTAASQAGAQCDVEFLDVLPGATQVLLHAISADGRTAVGQAQWQGLVVGVVETPAGFQAVTGSAWSSVQMRGISADGRVAVGRAAFPMGPIAPLRWTATAGVSLLPLAGTGYSSAEAVDASADGSVVVGTGLGTSIQRALVWRGAANPVELQIPGAAQTSAIAVSDDGSVVALNGLFVGGLRAYVWSAATGYVELDPGGQSRAARGISADGSVVVGSGTFGLDAGAFRWSAGTGLVHLTAFGENGLATACNHDGSIVVGATGSPIARAATWSDTTELVPLVDAVHGYSSATDVSEVGTLVGYVDPFGLGDFGTFRTARTELGASGCAAAAPNPTTLCIGRLSASGSPVVAQNALVLGVSYLPAGVTCLFLAGTDLASIPMAGGYGTLCLGGALGRFVGPGQIQTSDPSGGASLALDLTRLPTPTGPVAAQPGETWHFQCWHRTAGGSSSNLTDSVAVRFE